MTSASTRRSSRAASATSRALQRQAELCPRERDPLAITGLVGDGLDPLLTRAFAPLDLRTRSLTARLAALPELLEKARCFTDETPAIATATAIDQNQGLVDFCDVDIGQHLVMGLEAPLAVPLSEAAKKAAEALRGFGRYLRDDLAPRSKGSFRLGRTLFEKKLRLELDADVDVDAIAKGARELLERTLEEMVDTAARVVAELAPGERVPPASTRAERTALIRRALDLVAADRPTDATIVAEASTLLHETTRFVRERDLVRVPDEPCAVIEMPEYRRGFSIASTKTRPARSTPKPETFYAIAPTPAAWSPERSASFYREYNRSMLVDLTVHEAMPGHFLQLCSARRLMPVAGAFDLLERHASIVEGWAKPAASG